MKIGKPVKNITGEYYGENGLWNPNVHLLTSDKQFMLYIYNI